jgi:hypothetical protein
MKNEGKTEKRHEARTERMYGIVSMPFLLSVPTSGLSSAFLWELCWYGSFTISCVLAALSEPAAAEVLELEAAAAEEPVPLCEPAAAAAEALVQAAAESLEAAAAEAPEPLCEPAAAAAEEAAAEPAEPLADATDSSLLANSAAYCGRKKTKHKQRTT